jgi:hypothetical protein
MYKINSGDLTHFLLTAVKKTPGMFLMDTQLVSLMKFLTGYMIATKMNAPEKKDRFLENFSNWFLQRKNLDSNRMWYPSILEECNNSEESALLKFWEYLEIFNVEVPKVID